MTTEKTTDDTQTNPLTTTTPTTTAPETKGRDASETTGAAPRRDRFGRVLRRADFEIMAPAGSREAMMAAVRSGADSVYFGVGELNMRAHSTGDFTRADLPALARLLHENGVKAYLTVNTVLYDEDMEEMRTLVAEAKAAGIDAVIVSDPAAMTAAREAGIPAHLSTQLSIGNIESLKFYAPYADVAVLARELTLEQVARIHEAVETTPVVGPSGRPVRIEMFCHGALCMAVSGRCFMSLHTRGKSANRGACLQNCRRSYVLRDTDRDIELAVDDQYIMSPKDLKTIDFMDRLVDAGVRVFKIEGRARSPEYVLETVACYREALEAVLDGSYGDENRHAWDERLGRVFNRGFWDGWYLGRRVGELSGGYGSQATEKKVFVGTCIDYFARAKAGWFRIQAQHLEVGDKVLVTGPTTGAVTGTVTEMREEEKTVVKAEKGMCVTFPFDVKIRTNDKLYKLVGRKVQ